MKIDQIPLGTRFLLKGQTYTKVGPMTAAAEAGGTLFIPKHAVLHPVPGEAPPQAATTDTRPLDAAKVLAAFETYHRTALDCADEAARLQLESARQRFLNALRA